MFFKKNKAREPDAKPATPASQPKRPSARPAVPSIISPNLVVNGTLSSAGEIQIDGRVDGNVQSVVLIVSKEAIIRGNVFAQNVTVRGTIEGNIHAKMVLLGATCHVQGEIVHQAFAVESGAVLDGDCRHSDNPLEDNVVSNNVVEQSRKAPAIPNQLAIRQTTPLPVTIAQSRPVSSADLRP